MLTAGVNPLVHERIEYDAYGVPKLRLGADLNGDGQITFFDNSVFMGWYQNADPRADLNGDGAVDFFDLSAYLTMYNSQAYGAGGSLSDANTASGPGNLIGYAGYHWDAELQMWLSRHRVYDPGLGRWLQRDPAGYIDGMSLYAYVRGNPFAFVDPTGLAGAGDPGWIRRHEERQLKENLGMSTQETQEMRKDATADAIKGLAVVGSAFIPGPEDVVLASLGASGCLARLVLSSKAPRISSQRVMMQWMG